MFAVHPRARWVQSPYSAGFTLIEALVVVGLIGLLVGILIPAVQSAREAARRGQCVANLKQIGIAMGSYEAVHRMFPPSQLPAKAGVSFSKSNISELVFLLPFLEQQPLYSSINMDILVEFESAESPTLENHTARNTSLGILLCPSDGGSHNRNSYRFNRGRSGRWASGLSDDGPFCIGFLPRPAAIRDGLSRTAFVSERVSGSFVQGVNDQRRDIKFPGGLTGTATSDAQFIPECLAANPVQWEPTTGRYWMFSGFVYGHYNHNGAPNDPRPSCAWPSLRDWGPGGLSPPRSHHSGVVNVLHGDGHVEAVSNSITPAVWTALGTCNAGD